MSLPSGIVNFVFTDIEGSTRILKRLGPLYPAVLDRHRQLLRSAWEESGGHALHDEADSFFVAYERADMAARGCAIAQRRLRAERWPEGADVRVRMGIHAGIASPRDGDYVALAVHRAARVMGAAHGGQVLLTADVADGLAAQADVELQSLGHFRLRDFDEPVRLFQLVGAGLDGEFPAVRAVPAEGHNLVLPATRFVGRGNETDRLVTLLAAARLVTLTGPGGVGKTRLATEVGMQLASGWTDGVWLVDLAPIEDAALVAGTVASAVGVPVGAGADRWMDVLDHLRTRQVLVILDNVEHQVEVCSHLVPALLAACDRVRVLATSRERLAVAGEAVMQVAPLPLPSEGPTADGSVSPAVELFVDRARAVRPDLALQERVNVADAADICRRLDGLPLALEIAAARAGVMSLGDIRRGLEAGWGLLRSRDRSRPARQRTMDAVLMWSYRLLDPAEQAALRRLAIFGGGFSLDAAHVVVADGDIAADDVPELVWSLVDKSLIVADLTANDTRYRFLETVRAAASTHLDEAGEVAPTVSRLTAWFLDRVGPWRTPDGAWTSQVALELANLRPLVGAVAPIDEEAAQQLACVIGRFCDVTQRFRAGIEELARYADELRAPTPARVALLTSLADLELRVGLVAPASALVTEASELGAAVGLPPWDDAGIDRTRGEVAMRTDDLAGAKAIAAGALGRSLSARGRARMHNLLGIAHYRSGDLPAAAQAFDQELVALLELGHEAFVASAHGNCAEIALQLGDERRAAAHQLSCLQLALTLGQPVQLAFSLIVAARLASGAGEWEVAARLQVGADRILTEVGHVLYDEDRRISDELLATAKSRLGDVRYAAAAEAGQALDPGRAGDEAAEVLRRTGRVGAEVSSNQ